MEAEISPAADPQPEPTADGVLAAEILVEEISVDGMCGVY